MPYTHFSTVFILYWITVLYMYCTCTCSVQLKLDDSTVRTSTVRTSTVRCIGYLQSSAGVLYCMATSTWTNIVTTAMQQHDNDNWLNYPNEFMSFFAAVIIERPWGCNSSGKQKKKPFPLWHRTKPLKHSLTSMEATILTAMSDRQGLPSIQSGCCSPTQALAPLLRGTTLIVTFLSTMCWEHPLFHRRQYRK